MRRLFLGKKKSMGRGATELENLNEEGGELTFCYVGITRDTVCFTLPYPSYCFVMTT